MERVLYVFSKRGDQLEKKFAQRTALNLSSFCKDHHLEDEMFTKESWRTLTPNSMLVSPGIYHGDGLYPGDTNKNSFSCFGRVGYHPAGASATCVPRRYHVFMT
jgi:hypothetical protein